MPSQHINDRIWREIEKATVKAVVETRAPIKATDVMNYLLETGVKALTSEDFEQIAARAKK